MQHKVAHCTIKMSKVNLIIRIEGIKVRLHSSHHKDIGQAWAAEWIYPKNELFDTSLCASRLTLFNPDNIYCLTTDEYIGQSHIDNEEDIVYTVNADIKHHQYGSMKATNISIVDGYKGIIS